jgi:hypothetical protein
MIRLMPSRLLTSACSRAGSGPPVQMDVSGQRRNAAPRVAAGASLQVLVLRWATLAYTGIFGKARSLPHGRFVPRATYPKEPPPSKSAPALPSRHKP